MKSINLLLFKIQSTVIIIYHTCFQFKFIIDKKKIKQTIKNKSASKTFQTYNASGRHQVHLVPRGLHH